MPDVGSWGWEDWQTAQMDVMRNGVRSQAYGEVKKFLRDTLGEAGTGLSDQEMIDLMGTMADQGGRPAPQPDYGGVAPGTPMQGAQQAGAGMPNLDWLKKILKFRNPNQNPYGAVNWGDTGEQFGRSLERMKLRDE